MTDFKNLFRGAARLGVMVSALEVPFARVTGFVEAMSGELEAYQSMAVSSVGARLGLATRGAGKGFVHRRARLMDDAGVAEEELRRFLVRCAQFEHRGVEFGLHVLGELAGGFHYRLRAPHSLELAKAMLLDGGASAEGLAVVDETAARAGRRDAQAFACLVDHEGARRESVLLGRCPRSSLTQASIAALEGLEELGDPWLSVGTWGLELAIEGVPADWIGERGATLAAVFGKDRAARGQIRLSAGEIERDLVCERT